MHDIGYDIHFDLRCLEDQRYRHRGIGHFALSILKGLRSNKIRVVGIISKVGVETDSEIDMHIYKYVSIHEISLMPSIAVYFQPSPMSEEDITVKFPRETILIALIHDFIPLDYPDMYNIELQEKINYQQKLLALNNYNYYWTNSNSTKERAYNILQRPQSQFEVIGAPLRPDYKQDLYGLHKRSNNYVIVGGGDWRKNTLRAIFAVLLTQSDAKIDIVGGVTEFDKDQIENVLLLEYPSCKININHYISDEALCEMYGAATLCIAPSIAEGFSMPVIEAIASGGEVIASDIDVHRELIVADRLFDPLDINDLARKIENHKTPLLNRSWLRFDIEALQEDVFGLRISKLVRNHCENISRHNKLKHPHLQSRKRIALVTPIPPAQSGIADFSDTFIAELKKSHDVVVFSSLKSNSSYSLQSNIEVRPISSLAYNRKEFDHTITVLGNSAHHADALLYFLEFGGVCVLHDGKMTDLYNFKYETDFCLKIAGEELKRKVTEAEFKQWLTYPETSKVTMLSQIVEASNLCIVHNSRLLDLVQSKGRFIPFPGYNKFPYEFVSKEKWTSTRQSYHVKSEAFIILTLGFLTRDKGVVDLLYTLRLLRDWGVKAILVFCGEASKKFIDDIEGFITKNPDLQQCIVFFDHPVPWLDYTELISLADICVQLRQSNQSSISGALMDAAFVGVPCLASLPLAEALDAPSYVRRLSEPSSPVLIAEGIMAVRDRTRFDDQHIRDWSKYRAARSMKSYASRIISTLGELG